VGIEEDLLMLVEEQGVDGAEIVPVPVPMPVLKLELTAS
jgi:hypothetical protein